MNADRPECSGPGLEHHPLTGDAVGHLMPVLVEDGEPGVGQPVRVHRMVEGDDAAELDLPPPVGDHHVLAADRLEPGSEVRLETLAQGEPRTVRLGLSPSLLLELDADFPPAN